MKVILLKPVTKVGKKDEVVDVSDGYAHNALFPKKLAIPATPQAIASLQKKLAGAVSEKELQHDLLARSVVLLKEKTITIAARTNELGHLFGKIDAKIIADHLANEYRITIDAKALALAEPIKQTGTYEVPVVLDSYKGSFALVVTSQ